MPGGWRPQWRLTWTCSGTGPEDFGPAGRGSGSTNSGALCHVNPCDALKAEVSRSRCGGAGFSIQNLTVDCLRIDSDQWISMLNIDWCCHFGWERVRDNFHVYHMYSICIAYGAMVSRMEVAQLHHLFVDLNRGVAQCCPRTVYPSYENIHDASWRLFVVKGSWYISVEDDLWIYCM